MRIAFFGGTFDPIHNGHIAVAVAAAKRFRLQRVLFAPAGVPPLKEGAGITSFLHRYAMVALATAHDKRFVPSAIDFQGSDYAGPSYSIDTVRRLKRSLEKSDKLFFLAGIDAFCGIGKWHKASELLAEFEFIVASRPGFALRDLSEMELENATIHALDNVWSEISATRVRNLVSRAKPADRHLDPAVAAYIKKAGLYGKK